VQCLIFFDNRQATLRRHWLGCLWFLLALLCSSAALGATPFEKQVAELDGLRKQDRLASYRAAQALLSELSDKDKESPELRLRIFDVYCESLLASGYDTKAEPIARRGLVLAVLMNNKDYAFMMRGVLALLAYEHASPEGRAGLDALAKESETIIDVHARARFLHSYYDQLIYTDGVGDAARGLRSFGELVEHTPELAYFHRQFLMNVYRIHDATGDTRTAASTLKEALRLAEEAGDTLLEGQCLHQLGRVSGYEQDYALSNLYLTRAHKHAVQSGDLYRAFMANRNLARNHVAMGSHRAALEFANVAIKSESLASDPYDRASVHLYKARAHIGLAEEREAETSYLQALSILPLEKSTTNRWKSEAHRTSSELFELKGDLLSAMRDRKAYETELHQFNQEEAAKRIAAMREISNAQELDYRTERLEHERNQTKDALFRKQAQLNGWVLAASVVGAMFLGAGIFAWKKKREAGAFKLRLQVDALTQGLSRVAIEASLLAAIVRSRKLRVPLSVLLLDIDAFKAINDTHGHAAGDEALQWVVKRARDVVRPNDDVGRLGGDEFLIVLPGASAAVAAQTAERLRVAISEEGAFSFGKIDVSIGVATASDTATPKSLLGLADSSMYEAKRKRKSATR
jgi:diguanylate cyclase (GGDEF)-like protein